MENQLSTNSNNQRQKEERQPWRVAHLISNWLHCYPYALLQHKQGTHSEKKMMPNIRNVLLISACYSKGVGAFANLPTKSRCISSLQNNRNSPGFVGFSGDDNPVRSYGASNTGRSINDPFSSQTYTRGGAGRAWQEPSSNMYGQVYDRHGSNLSPYSRPSVNDIDPRYINIERDRYSQRPHPSTMMAPHREQQSPWRGMDGRIQGGSRYTYDNYGSSQTFVETDGRPLNVEMEVYFDDENSISGFYAGQFKFKGERIK